MMKTPPTMKPVIILDPAHGCDVAGKGSPDGTHKEWNWSRRLCRKLSDQLKLHKFGVILSNNLDTEIGINARLKLMNQVAHPAFVLSLHNNAAGMGKDWMNARGWSVWTTPGVTKSDKYATIIFDTLRSELPELPFRKDFSDGDPDYEANFGVLKSKHPSVMLEWLFMDNKEDLKLIKDETIINRLVDALVKSIILISNEYEK